MMKTYAIIMIIVMIIGLLMMLIGIVGSKWDIARLTPYCKIFAFFTFAGFGLLVVSLLGMAISFIRGTIMRRR